PSLFVLHDPATPEIYTLSLHDALPIYDGAIGIWPPAPSNHRGGKSAYGSCGQGASTPSSWGNRPGRGAVGGSRWERGQSGRGGRDRKSTRLNSSHVKISYAVFCLKKKT